MIYTSYFAKLKSLPENVIPVAICAKVPEWYKGLHYKKLAPTYNTLMKYKKDHNEEDYIISYESETLAGLEVSYTLSEIYDLLPRGEWGPREMIEMMNCPPWENPKYHIALICYEKPEDFCHRHIVEKWLKKSGIRCEEWRGQNV